MKLHCALALSLLLSWAAVGLGTGFLCPMAASNRGAVAAVCLLALLFVSWVATPRPARWPDVAWLCLGVAGVAIAAWWRDEAALGAALALTAGAGWSRAGASRSASNHLLSQAVGAAVFALLVAVRMLPEVRTAFSSGAGAISWSSTLWCGEEVHLGPSAVGLEGMAFAVCLVLGAAACHRDRPGVAWLAVAAVALPVAAGVYGCWLAGHAAAVRPFTYEAYEEGPIWFRGLWWLWLLFWAFSVAALRRSTSRPATVASRGVWLPVVIGLSACVATLRLPAGGGDRGAVLLISHPGDSRLQAASEPSGYHEDDRFGAALRVLRAGGHHVETSEGRRLDAELLAGFQVVIFLHPDVPTADDRAALATWMRERGGGLILVSDHTPSHADLAEINALLDPVGIHYEFDSAFLYGSLGDVGRGDGSALANALWRSPAITHGVGASLTLSGSAQAVLEARWVVGDRGHDSTPSLLGNRHYENGDALGDRVVVAYANHGGGRIVVVADTGPLSDSATPFSYPWLLQLVATAIAGSGGGPGWLRLLAAAAAALGVVVSWRSTVATGVFAACFGLVAGALVSRAAEPPLRELAGPGLVAIDVSHGSHTVAMARATDRSIRGFANQAYRLGFCPIVSGEGDVVQASSHHALVLVAPVVQLGQDQVDDLLRFIDGGGTVIVACGFEERGPVQPLLSALGVEVTSRLLAGSLHRQSRIEPSGDGGPRVRHVESWQLRVRDGLDHEVLFALEGAPVAVEARRGAGRVVVIGDSWFLCDDNLQSPRSLQPANVALARRILIGR